MAPPVRRTAATTTSRPRIGGTPAGRPASGFQYKPRTPEEVKERASRAVGGRDGYFNPDVKYFTPREGLNTIRILPMPPQKDWRHYGFTLYQHRDIGPDKSSYLCLAKMKGEPCPICDLRSEASAANEDDLAKSLNWGERVPRYIIDRAREVDGPQIWNVSGGMDKDITKLETDPSSGEVLLPDHPDDGYDFSFTRTGSGLKTKYSGFQFLRRASPLSEDPVKQEEWLKYITDHPIDEMLIYKDADYLQRQLDGQPVAAAPAPAPAAAEQPNPRTAVHTESGGRLKPRAAPNPPPPPVEEPAGEDEVPTWDDLMAMDETQLGELGDSYEGFPWPNKNFGSVDEMREHVAKELGIEMPPPPPPPGANGKANWRDRFNKNK